MRYPAGYVLTNYEQIDLLSQKLDEPKSFEVTFSSVLGSIALGYPDAEGLHETHTATMTCDVTPERAILSLTDFTDDVNQEPGFTLAPRIWDKPFKRDERARYQSLHLRIQPDSWQYLKAVDGQQLKDLDWYSQHDLDVVFRFMYGHLDEQVRKQQLARRKIS